MSKQVQQFIESAIDAKVPAQYKSSPFVESARQAVTDAVIVQADKVADGLRAIAQREGLSESLVENALIEVGLADAPEPVEPETLEAKVERLVAAVDAGNARIEALIARAKSYSPVFRDL